MGVSITCYRCDGTGARDAGPCYVCDGLGTLKAERVRYLVDVAIPEAIDTYTRTGRKKGLSPSLSHQLLCFGGCARRLIRRCVSALAVGPLIDRCRI